MVHHSKDEVMSAKTEMKTALGLKDGQNLGRQGHVEGTAGKSTDLVRTRPERTWIGERGEGLLRRGRSRGKCC